MPVPPRTVSDASIDTQLNAMFVSLELSRSTWLVTSLSPGFGERMSKHGEGGDLPALLARFDQLQLKSQQRLVPDTRSS
jgi:transposase